MCLSSGALAAPELDIRSNDVVDLRGWEPPPTQRPSLGFDDIDATVLREFAAGTSTPGPVQRATRRQRPAARAAAISQPGPLSEPWTLLVLGAALALAARRMRRPQSS